MRAGYIEHNQHDEAVQESEYKLMTNEKPEIIVDGLKVMRDHFGIPTAAIAREMRVKPSLLDSPLPPPFTARAENVVVFRR